MTIDYDQLRELLDDATPGPWEDSAGVAGVPEGWDEYWVMIRIGHNNFSLRSLEPLDKEDYANFNLTALAPDMARELLNLRDGVEELRDELADLHHAGRVYGGKKTKATVTARLIADFLTALLDGEQQ